MFENLTLNVMEDESPLEVCILPSHTNLIRTLDINVTTLSGTAMGKTIFDIRSFCK